MPAEAIAPPPAAPAPAAPAASTPPQPDLISPASPAAPPKPGTARERMRQGTAAKWEGTIAEEPKAPVAKPSSAPTEAPTPGEKAGGDEQPSPTAPPEVEAKDKKQNPWKLYREEKARAAALERQIEEVKTKGLSEGEKSEYLTRVEKAEAKLREYEQEIQFKAYEKSDDYKTKFEQPYTEAWSRHMADLRGVTVEGEDGVARPMEAKDILDLVNLELPDARALAKAKWGDFADDAMSARKEIRNLFETKTRALDEARKNGAEREKQTQERVQKWMADTTKHVGTVWNEANAEAVADPENGQYFKPVEGDDTRNQLLGKGFALVDKGFSQNPMDPKLTPEQRTEAVRRHAAIRNRAAAFGPLKYLVKKLTQEVAELKKANGQFKTSAPPTAGGTTAPATGATTSARERMRQAGEKYVR